MRQKLLNIAVAAACTILVCHLATAQYKLVGGVVGGGGGLCVCSSHSITGTTGQAITGVLSSATYKIYSGYWYAQHSLVTGVGQTREDLPVVYQLWQNYPNPFNPSTAIPFALPCRAYVTLTVFNVLGQQVAVPLKEEREPGYHQVKFVGTGLASGVYFYTLHARSLSPAKGGERDFTSTMKLMILK